MRFLSVCSGIGCADLAFQRLGWEAAAMSEIEAFPRAVLAHRFAGVPVHGDFTTIQGDTYGPVQLLVGGTPCQSFSIAGLRGGMEDVRGNLALEYLRLAERLRARWLVYENVPGLLSSNGGRDFGAFLGGMAELGYGFAYRVLDAQHFGCALPRPRVFVVGYLGDWRRAVAALFEPAAFRDSPQRSIGRTRGHTLSVQNAGSRNGRGNPICSGGVLRGMSPLECERALGLPDGHTLIPYRGGMAADGPRYKAIGNGMAVPCLSWIGRRIAMVEAQQVLEVAA